MTTTTDTMQMLSTLAKGMENIMERLAALETPQESKPQAQKSDGPTLEAIKAYAKAKGMNIQGKVTDARVQQWTALYMADHGESPKVENVQSSSTRWGDFQTSKPSAERQFGIPKKSEAIEMFRVHPERSVVESLTTDELFAFSQAGKSNAKVAQFRNVPLNGNHRKCIGLKARGTKSPNVDLVVADAVQIAKASGVKF